MLTFGYRLVTDADGRIEYRQRDEKKKQFHLAVYVDAPDGELNTIRMVEYHLHETFSEPVRHNDHRETRFEERFWTWGIFDIIAVVLRTDGSTDRYRFRLDYSLPPDYGLNYVRRPFD